MNNLDFNKSGSKVKPRKTPGAFRAIFLAIVSVTMLALAAYWLTRPEAEKVSLRQQAVDRMASLLEGTPLARLADIFKPAPEPLPSAVTNPATESGTLSGQDVMATVAAPLDFGPGIPAPLLPPKPTDVAAMQPQAAASLPGNGEAGQRVTFSQETVPPVTEDTRVRPDHIARLANWLASQYKPGTQGGWLDANVQALNHECGVRMAGQAPGGRAGLLNYAFHPAMISGLYNLYIGRFMADLDAAAKGRGLNAAQNRQFHRALAGRAAALASGLAGVQRVPELGAKLAHIDDLAQKTVDANSDLTSAVFELDQLRESHGSKQERATAQMRVDGATARYRRASEEHARAQTALAAEIRRYSGQNMEEDALLFMAAWVARRYAQSGQARGAVESCISALRDLSARCARYGEDS